ncbi:helix-turn-helix domain-containing protein [Micromonospora sp. NPDC048999]|uniref:helix-turn-helix domain-containing protein n=1 Tax=Micromonospora sp. NPDC048999 TaxID=3155391 RepID=UPI0033E04F31
MESGASSFPWTVTDVVTAAAILGIGRTKAYELAKAEQLPVRTFKVGRHYRIPVAAILELLTKGTDARLPADGQGPM